MYCGRLLLPIKIRFSLKTSYLLLVPVTFTFSGKKCIHPSSGDRMYVLYPLIPFLLNLSRSITLVWNAGCNLHLEIRLVVLYFVDIKLNDGITIKDDTMDNSLKKVVVVGGGFAGINLVKKLSKDKRFHITLVDKNNY